MASDLQTENRALKAALREARLQHYHLFNVQRQRTFLARQREKDQVRELREAYKKLREAEKTLAKLEGPLGKLRDSLLGKLGSKQVDRVMDVLRKAEVWTGAVPSDLPHPSGIFRAEDEDEALEVPFLTPTVDVVICVHNALEDVKACLASVEARSPRLQKIILVNDGSDEATTEFLRAFAVESELPVEIVHHPEARGYTIAANRGLERTHADYVVILNSDTVVTHHWLESILACGESDPRIGIIGPLSNAGSWQSVPERFGPEGDWEVNELPEGISPDDVACRLLLEHEPAYPRVPLINGFCFVIKRRVLHEIGLLDEATFPRGYGEENDFCLRAGAAGFELAVADNAYVFHAKSKSFTHDRRRELSKAATGRLHEKHGREVIDAACQELRDDPGLARAREHFSELQSRPVSLRILFIVNFKGEGGGMHSIAQECDGLCRLGAFAQMAVRQDLLDFYRLKYATFPDARFYPYQFDYQLAAYAGSFDVVVSTLFSSVDRLKQIVERYPSVRPAYYIQDYEPLFFDESDALYAQARASYTALPEAIRFAKTKWLCDVVSEREGVEVHKVTPSIDHAVYRPAEGAKPSPWVVAAMIRPSTPRRAPELTLEVLKTLKTEFGERIRSVVFGCEPADPFWEENGGAGGVEIRGVLPREGVAEVLREASVFLDLSTYQAFGRTALEAMACGCVPVVPKHGGPGEYARDRENALVVDTEDRDAVLEAARELLRDEDLREKLREAGLEAAKAFTVEAAAQSELDLFLRMTGKG